MSVKEFNHFAHVIAAVCRHFGIRVEMIDSETREWKAVWPRFVAIGLAMEFTNLTKADLAALFGMNHGSMGHAQRRLKEECAVNAKAREQVDAIRLELEPVLGTLKGLRKAA